LQAAKLAAKTTAVDESYGNAALEGLNVSHSATDFEAGTETILTLKDESILTRTVGGLVDDIAEGSNSLENVNLADEKKTADAIKKRREVSQQLGAGGYTVRSRASEANRTPAVAAFFYCVEAKRSVLLSLL